MSFEQRLNEWSDFKGYKVLGFDGGYVFFSTAEKGVFPIAEDILHEAMKRDGY